MNKFLRPLATFAAAVVMLTVAAVAAPFGNSTFQPLQTSTGRNFCSSSSINQKQHYYLTAGHCVNQDTDDPPPPAHMYGMQATTVFLDVANDIAVVRAAFGAPALSVSDVAPQNGDPIHVTGFPFGWTKVQTQYGTYVSTGQEQREGVSYAIFDLTVAGGNSGSPVLNPAGRIVSVLQVKWLSTNFSGGCLFGALAEIEPFTE